MNKVVLIGRLVRDPELKFTPNTGTAVASFTLAVDRMRANKEGEREPDFIPVVVFGKQAEAVANYVGKGKLIGVSGRIQTRSYETKDGGKRHVTEVVADETQFIEWGRKAEQQASQVGEYDNDLTPVDDGDIPF